MNRHQKTPNTYFVQNQSPETTNQELARLDAQSQMLIADMGGVLPEQPEPTLFQHVLDLGCGTGNWLIEMAKAYPQMSLLIGVDINPKMIAYAKSQARAHKVSDRVHFQTMDVLGTFAFAANHFDLVNQRLGQSYVRTWEWPLLLAECQRVSKARGTIRLTEVETIAESNSEAVARLGQLFIQALSEAGHSFTPDSQGITNHLARQLQAKGLQGIQTCMHTVIYRGATTEGDRFAQSLEQLFQSSLPFVRKWTQVPDTYEKIYQQAVHDMHQADFMATWRQLTAWGVKPE